MREMGSNYDGEYGLTPTVNILNQQRLTDEAVYIDTIERFGYLPVKPFILGCAINTSCKYGTPTPSYNTYE